MAEVINRIVRKDVRELWDLPPGSFFAESLSDIDEGILFLKTEKGCVDIQTGSIVPISNDKEVYCLDVKIYVEGLL